MDLKTFCSEHAGRVETAGRALGPLAAAPLVPPWSPPDSGPKNTTVLMNSPSPVTSVAQSQTEADPRPQERGAE